MALPPKTISEHYSFTFTTGELKIYNFENQDYRETLSMHVGDYFRWRDQGSSYKLTLKEVLTDEVRVAALIENPGMPGGATEYGKFELSVRLSGAEETSVSEVYIEA